MLSGINGQYSSILSTVAVQIAIFEILQNSNIIPNEIIGHSYGKFAAAYANGLLTLQQTLKGAYNAAKYFLGKNGELFELWNDLKNDLSNEQGNLDFKAYKCIQDIIDNIKCSNQEICVSSNNSIVLQLGVSLSESPIDVFSLPSKEGNSLISFLMFIGRYC